MPLVMIMTAAEWRQKHGVPVSDNDPRRPPDLHRRFLFPTGASSEATAGAEPTFVDPPADPEQRLLAQARYHDLTCRKILEEFAKLQNVALGRVEQYGGPVTWAWPKDPLFGAPPPPSYAPAVGGLDAAPALEKLRDLAKFHFGKAEGIRAEIAAIPAVALRRKEAELRKKQAEAAEESRRSAAAAQVSRVAAIKFDGELADLFARVAANVRRGEHPTDEWSSRRNAMPVRGGQP
jgi:hypothetical protein